MNILHVLTSESTSSVKTRVGYLVFMSDLLVWWIQISGWCWRSDVAVIQRTTYRKTRKNPWENNQKDGKG